MLSRLPWGYGTVEIVFAQGMVTSGIFAQELDPVNDNWRINQVLTLI